MVKHLGLVKQFWLHTVLVAAVFAGAFVLVSERFERDVISEMTAHLQAELPVLIGHHLEPGELELPKLAPSDYEAFADKIAFLLNDRVFLRLKFFNPQGILVWSDVPELVGRSFAESAGVQTALGGQVTTQVTGVSDPEHFYERNLGHQRLLESHIPLRSQDGLVIGAAEVYQPADPTFARITHARWSVGVPLTIGVVVIYLALYRIVRQGNSLIEEQTREIKESHTRLEQALMETVTSLSRTVDARDPYTHGHSARVAEVAGAIGHALGFSPAHLQDLQRAALLHDMGKIGIGDSILRKSGPLTREEREVIRSHPEIGVNILGDIRFFAAIVPWIRHHHEHFDGTGYPGGLTGGEIPLPARILSVADALDAMTSNRPYRPARSLEEAVDELRRYAGIQFDPEVVAVVCQLLRNGQPSPTI